MDTVTVSKVALKQIIDALNGPPHLILELLHTRGVALAELTGNPIDVLQAQMDKPVASPQIELRFNANVDFDEKALRESLESHFRNDRQQYVIAAHPECPYSDDPDYTNCALHNHKRNGVDVV